MLLMGDAPNSQRATACAIVAAKADYLFAGMGIQRVLQRAIQVMLHIEQSNQEAGPKPDNLPEA